MFAKTTHVMQNCINEADKRKKSESTIVDVQDRKIKMFFNTGGTWRQVTFEKLMMKIYDFFN